MEFLDDTRKIYLKRFFFQRMLFLDGYQGRGGGYLCTVTYRHIIVSWKIAYKSGFFYAALGRQGHYQCAPSILSDVKMDDGTYDQLLILMSLDHQSPLSVRENLRTSLMVYATTFYCCHTPSRWCFLSA
jgi:hypothetical protein